MWKNKGDRKNLIKVYVLYKIKGLNLDRFINHIKNKGIVLYDIKKISNKELIVSVSYNDSQKFFAIAKNLCYNIKKVCEKGSGLFLLNLFRRMGIIIGFAIFMLSSIFFNDLILSIDYSGSGSELKREVQSFLADKGIEKYSLFSKIDIEKLEDEILSRHENLSFVSIKKHGNKMLINLALSKEPIKRLNSDIYALHSNVDGEIEKINIYRGTAMISVGDKVKKGDLLVDGFMSIKDNLIKTNVLASISIIAEKTYTYVDKLDNAEDKALLLFKGEFSDMEIISHSIIKHKENDQFVYQITAKYRAIVCTK